ncbi:MAG: hypothetical protein QOG71_3852 [Pyrinomonadaceae bacterium]|nr:hypothetical protein [Pyrinomonadaceae bacterium]
MRTEPCPKCSTLLLLDEDLIACPSCGALLEVLTFDRPVLGSDSSALRLIPEASPDGDADMRRPLPRQDIQSTGALGGHTVHDGDFIKPGAEPEAVLMGATPPPILLASDSGSKLYSVGQITLATYLGAPVAGCLLLARNYRALGKSDAAWQPIVVGIASTILLFTIAFLLPENFPDKVLPFGYTSAMYWFARQWEGGAIDNHLNAGSRKGSWAVTIVVGLGCTAIVLGLLIAFTLAFDL